MQKKSSKKDKEQALKALFNKKKALKIEDLFKVIETTSRMTVHRYLKELEYLTSYTHKGRYYTLTEIAQFDAHGLWYYGDIGFSKHGTLFETVTYLVNSSEKGMTATELHIESQRIVKHALLDLVEKGKLSRVKPDNWYVYLSSDSSKAEKQLKKRQAMIKIIIDDSTALRVILMAYRLRKKDVSPELVADSLQKEGSKISQETVYQVFKQHELEKEI